MAFDLNSLNFLTRISLPPELSPLWMLTYLSAPLGGEYYAEVRCRPPESEPALLGTCGVGVRPTLRQYVPQAQERQRLLTALGDEAEEHRALHILPWSAKQRVVLEGEEVPVSRQTQALFGLAECGSVSLYAFQLLLNSEEAEAERVLRMWVQEGIAEERPLPFFLYCSRVECWLGGYELWKRGTASSPWVKAADLLLQPPPRYDRHVPFWARGKDYARSLSSVVACLEGMLPAEPTSAMYPLVPSLFLVRTNEPDDSDIPF